MADGTSIPIGVMASAGDKPGGENTMQRFAQRRSTTGFLLCLPLILLVAGFVIYPAFYAIYLSMLNKKMTAFVGLGNFQFLLKRHTFQLVIFQSCLFAITSVVFKALIGFMLAHLMHNIPGKNQRIWRGLLLVPWVIPLALSTLTWWWMFDPSYSAFNWVLNQFGIANVPWLGVGWIARFCTITVNVWYRHAVLHDHVSGGAEVGAGATVSKLRRSMARRRCRSCSSSRLPMMRNIIAITVLFSLIVTFADFDIVRILTAGGPQDMTHVFATYAFQVGIQSGDIPLGAADSLFMFPILAFAAFFVLRGVTQADQGDRRHERHRHAERRIAVAAARKTQPASAADVGAVGQLRGAGGIRHHVPGAAILHADDQSEVLGGDLGAGRESMAGAASDAGELLVPDHLPEFSDATTSTRSWSRS